MRILAMRGENLASLDGPFEVDLQGEALGRFGLFAITGPTGAGKSTLLDAMCLALFDKTPRLVGSSKVAVGRADEDEALKLGSHDPRSVLRRGRASGFAEVDFRGKDGRAYRARWSVSRARNRPNGRCQTQEVALTALDSGETFGRTKTEILGEIQDRLGLSFDQFRRSVLLAQGDFDRFLKATHNERAELLERMTGTQIYAEISRRAFARAKEEEEKRRRLLGDIEGQALLSDEDRLALESGIEAKKSFASEIEKDLEGAKEAMRWHARTEELFGAVGGAEAALLEEKTAWDGASADREQLAAVEQAQPLRGVIAGLDRAIEELGQAKEREEQTERDLLAARERLDDAKLANEQTAEAHGAARAELAASEPLIAEARRLDTEASGLQEQRDEVRARAKSSERALRQAREKASSLTRDEAEAEQALLEARARLDADVEVTALADEWPRWSSLFNRLSRSRAEAKSIAGRLPELEAALAGARTREAAAREGLEGCERQLEEARLETSRKEWEAKARPASVTREEREAAGKRRDLLERLARLHEEAKAGKTELAEQLQGASDARLARAGAAREAADAAESIPELHGQVEEAERNLSRLEATLALEERRPELRDGEPCPLCGATEHPFAVELGPIPALIGEAKERIGDLRERQRRAISREAAARKAIEAAEAREQDYDGRARRAERGLDSMREQWGRLLGEIAPPPSISMDDDALPSLVAESKSLEARMLALREEELARESLQRAALEARSKLESHHDEVKGAGARLKEAEAAVSVASKGLDEAEARSARLEDDCSEALAELEPALSPIEGWEAAIDRDAAAFIELCEERVATVHEARRRSEENGRRLEELGRGIETANTLVEERTCAFNQIQAQAAKLDERIEGLLGRRSALLGGDPTDEVERELKAAVQATEAALSKAGSELGLASSRHAAASSLLQAAQEHRAKATRARDEAEADARGRLTEIGLDLDTARARLAFDDAWSKEQRERLESMKKRVHEAETVLAERVRALEQHTSGAAAPDMDKAKAAETRLHLEAELLAAGEELQTLRASLKRDDQARDKVMTIRVALEQQTEKAGLWSNLNDLIGSADGKKFRVFAQSLTLDLLLDHANHHLLELSGRYRLMRVPNHDLDLQIVDRAMADEIRGVQSLSGGETFLVSLALALGLSSLASRETVIDSLFIDEGFGTLDARTLETVLSSLEALQATGRQVGIISHVGGIAERVGAQVRVEALGAGRSRVDVAVA